MRKNWARGRRSAATSGCIGGEPAGTGPAHPAQQFCLDPAKAAGWHVTTLIATVPNPELTHLSLTFDRYIESITWALDDGDLDSAKATPSIAIGFPGTPIRKPGRIQEQGTAAEKDRARRSDMPGILLFRRRQQSPDPAHLHPEKDLLMVFLVGETPTDGINRAAFNQSLGLCHEPGEYSSAHLRECPKRFQVLRRHPRPELHRLAAFPETPARQSARKLARP